MSRNPHEAINVRDPEIGDGHYPPQSAQNQESQGISNFVDGSGHIFSMYLETATEEDKKMAENWKADAEGILIFTGLFSAAVASLISVSIQDIRLNPQDTSNFYLANIYQTVADPNSSNISSSLPSSPPSFSPPNYAVWVNALWFMSLVISLTCALLATLLQQWARRYLKVTQPRYSPHKRARIRSFFFEGVDKYLVSFLVDALPALLHVSLYLFFGGLVVFLCNVNVTIFALVLSWVCFCTAVYGFITFIPIFRYNSPYSTPLTSLAWPTVIGIPYITFRALRKLAYLDDFRGPVYNYFQSLEESYRKLLAQGVQKTAEETALNSPSEIDTRAFMWTFDSLDEDHELERFFFGLPGFRISKVVDDPLPSLSWDQKEKLLNALIGLSDRTSSSDLLPESVKNRRAAICAKALGPVEVDIADLHLLQGIMSEREFRPVESVGIATLLRDWGYNKGENTPLVISAIVSSIVAYVRLRDDLWFGIASDELGVPESVLRDYAAHGDNLSLAILVHVTCQQFSHYEKRSWQEYTFSSVLERASKFDVQDTSPQLQHEFCALWNQIVHKAQNDDDKSMAWYTLRSIRNVFLALHQGTNSAPTRFSVSTGDQDGILFYPTTYPVCSVAGHIHNDTASTTSFVHIAAPVSAPLASPDLPSSSVPAPRLDNEGPMDVPPLDNNVYAPRLFQLAHPTTIETLHIPATSPDLATAGAIQDAITSGITILHPTPETSTLAPPLSSTSPSAAIALQHDPDPLTPSDTLNLPSSDPLLDKILPTGPPLSSHPPITRSGPSPSFPESHRSIIVTTAPSASAGPTSAPDLGAATEDDGSPKPGLRGDKDIDGPSSVNRAILANTMTTLDLPLQSPSLQSVADSDIVVAGPTLREPNAEFTGDHPPYPPHGRYDIV